YVIFGQAPTGDVTRTGTNVGNRIHGGSGNDTLSGLGGKDSLFGGGGNDILDGGAGNDALFGGSGVDIMLGGDGNDRVWLANGDSAPGEPVDGGAGNDAIVLIEPTTVDLSQGTLANVEKLVGSVGDDTVTLTVLQWSALTAVNLRGGNDTLTVLAQGATDI